jgi:hypothetical protein
LSAAAGGGDRHRSSRRHARWSSTAARELLRQPNVRPRFAEQLLVACFDQMERCGFLTQPRR